MGREGGSSIRGFRDGGVGEGGWDVVIWAVDRVEWFTVCEITPAMVSSSVMPNQRVRFIYQDSERCFC